MTCQCGNVQCFLCSKNVADYSHFGDAIGQCQMYGDMKEYLEKQVLAAQETTVKRILQSRSDLKEDDIRVDNAPNIRPVIIENNAQRQSNNLVNTNPWIMPGAIPLFPPFPTIPLPAGPPNVLPPIELPRYPAIVPPPINQSLSSAIQTPYPIGVLEGYLGQNLHNTNRNNYAPTLRNVPIQAPQPEYAYNMTQTDFRARNNQTLQGAWEEYFKGKAKSSANPYNLL